MFKEIREIWSNFPELGLTTKFGIGFIDKDGDFSNEEVA